MAILKLVTIPDPILRRKAAPVEHVDDEIRQLIHDMTETAHADDAAGLAAPQVGVSKRVVIIDIEDRRKPDCPRTTLKMINPEILWSSEEKEPFPQGCFSVPGFYTEIVRPKKIRIQFLDENGIRQEVKLEGPPSHCVQHEIDHLNGILFIDYLSPMKRQMAIKKAQKYNKASNAS